MLFSSKREGNPLSHATTRMNLEDIMLIEIKQSQEDKDCITIDEASKSSQIHKNRKWHQGLEGRRNRVVFNRHACQICKRKEF